MLDQPIQAPSELCILSSESSEHVKLQALSLDQVPELMKSPSRVVIASFLCPAPGLGASFEGYSPVNLDQITTSGFDFEHRVLVLRSPWYCNAGLTSRAWRLCDSSMRKEVFASCCKAPEERQK